MAVIRRPKEPQSPAKSATTSHAPDYQASLSLPAELIQHICKDLDRQTLKNFRLVCKYFSYVAEVFLFREVLLRRNAHSFEKLRLIAGHRRLSTFVHSFQYIATLLTTDDVPGKSKEWSEAFTGAMTLDGSSTRRMCWRQSCMQLRTDRLMEVSQHLCSAFSKLPSLREVCFTWDEKHLPTTHCPTCQHQQKVVEPECSLDSNPETDLQFRTGQLIILLRAARYLLEPLTTVEMLGVPWVVFGEPGQIPRLMVSVTKGCQFIALRLVHEQEWWKSSVAGILSNASYLHTLEVSFEPISPQGTTQTVGLSDILGVGTRWPNLKRLKLQGLWAYDVDLIMLLTTHAATLSSLELADIELAEHLTVQGVPRVIWACSWVDVILFLQRSLKLEVVRLDGTLSTQHGEVWESHEPNELPFWPSGNSRLKHRIEQYIVEGGTFPFPPLTEVQEAEGWENMDLGDSSWHHCGWFGQQCSASPP